MSFKARPCCEFDGCTVRTRQRFSIDRWYADKPRTLRLCRTHQAHFRDWGFELEPA